MTLLKSPSKVFIFIAVIAAFAAGSAMGASAMWTAYGQNGEIVACVSRNGAIRLVNATTECKQTETSLTWNVQGPAGQDGANGQDGNLQLANQMCSDGSYVVGFDNDGNILCSDGSTGVGGGGGGGGGACTPEPEILDGIDNDCDGQIDENLGDAYADLDGDGWLGYEDCDDTDPNVNPNMVEIVGDGIDNNCDGIAE